MTQQIQNRINSLVGALNVIQDSTLTLIYDLANENNQVKQELDSVKKENEELKTKLDEQFKKS